MTPNFVKGVLTAYRTGDYFKLITNFGTCYVTEVIMGGRTTQEIIYESDQLSQMMVTGTTIEAAANATFGKLYSTGNFNSTTNNETSSYAESYSNSIR